MFPGRNFCQHPVLNLKNTVQVCHYCPQHNWTDRQSKNKKKKIYIVGGSNAMTPKMYATKPQCNSDYWEYTDIQFRGLYRLYKQHTVYKCQ